ncbi:alpha-amylase family protein [Aquipuribacter nitratireducens]|uniref:Alpha-amylase family protein n=1 Tax=Aquipuribacter nitratireducens TaxID=650104 RepID=A0ABW0GMB0_9MICO
MAAPTPDVHDELFELRLERWLPDLDAGLAGAYEPEQCEALRTAVVRVLRRAHAARRPVLRQHDQRRLLRPDWFQREDVLGYAAYTERFAGDLDGVRRRIGYLEELGVTYLHLLPLLEPRPGDNDGGYAVADYRRVRADLGTNDDLARLADTLHEHGISLCVDLVLNHVAYEHEWARRARAGEERYRRYFRVFPDRKEPDAYEQTLPEVFPDFAPGNFTWDDDLDGWVWTTFNSWQWDVDWSNPDVFVEYLEIVCHLANLGVDVLRLDAIAFLWKRLGTTCQNEPEVHALTQALRAALRVVAPAVALKAEAIVGPRDLVPYLGTGRHHGKVSDLAYHNSLMVQVWSMLASRDVRLTVHALRQFPPVPSTTAWITYVRCHDDIGWAVDDGDAAAVGLSGYAHRAFLADYYTGGFPGSFGRGLTFQHNPETGDRRTSGTAASLLGVDAALEQPEGPDRLRALDGAVARLLLAHAVVIGFGGVPVIWSGDELGLRDDPVWFDEPGHGGDNRWAHRPRIPWEPNALGEHAADRHDPTSVAGRVFGGLAALARARAGLPQLHAAVPSEALDPVHDGVLAIVRRHPVGSLLALYNVTEHAADVPGWLLHAHGLAAARDHVAGRDVDVAAHEVLTLPPYAACWLTAR